MDNNIIHLRQKKLKNGGASLYLEFYSNGRRTFEFLKMYLVPEVDQASKMQNKRTYEAAKVILARKLLEYSENRSGMVSSSKRNALFIDVANKIIEMKRGNVCKGTSFEQGRVVTLFDNYAPGIRIADIDEQTLYGFLRYMRSIKSGRGEDYHPNTIYVYWTKLNHIFNLAVKMGYISKSPVGIMTNKPVCQQVIRNYLTIQELEKMMATPAGNDMVKRMFLFACFTGLRYSDVIRVTWDMIDQGGIRINQKKTNIAVYVPLTANAMKWLPKRGISDGYDIVFADYVSLYGCEKVLKKWAESAGITKKVTFHISRHTFATLCISSGIDIYTTSSLLGHTNVKTTQLYAKVIDEKKVTELAKIPEL